MRRCEVCFAPLPPWAEAYLWPCVRGGLTVCADCFDTLVGSLSRRELAARLGAPGVGGGAQKKNPPTVWTGRITCDFSLRF